MASMATQSVSLPVVFSTQTPYPLPSQKFMIPASWKRYQLSQLVNKALGLTNPVPFDFLVRGEILRATLAEWCAENGVGEEETLDLEYIESILPPQKMSDIPHEDWVSSVSCQLAGHFVTASYDGHIRSFDYSKNPTCSLAAHAAPVTSIAIVSSPSPEDILIASASHDLTGQLIQLTIDSSSPIPSSSSKSLATLHLHTSPLSSITSDGSGSHLLTASWDSLIGLWDTSVPSIDEVPLDNVTNSSGRKKRRKVDDGKIRAKRKAPLLVLKSHTDRVSRAVFGCDGAKAFSCGFDSSVRVWDTERGLCTQTITACEKPFTCLTVTPSGDTALATSTDKTLSVYDLRSSTSPLTASFIHPAMPSCLTLGADSSFQVMSGAYDGVVRIWDLRSVKGSLPVSSFRVWDGTRKILALDWARGVVGIGGEGGFEVWKLVEETQKKTLPSTS